MTTACNTFGILGCYNANAVFTTGAKLRLILYSDGVVPGSVLSSDNRRKSAAWYVSFLEFGPRLSYEEVWLPFAFARTARSLNFLKGDYRTRWPPLFYIWHARGDNRSKLQGAGGDYRFNLRQPLKLEDPRTAWMKAVLGGWSALTQTLLHQMFVNDKVSTVGIILPLTEGPTTVRVEFGMMIGDEEAITAMWHIKGASGLLPCGLKCMVTNKPCHTDVAQGIDSLSARDGEIPDLATHEPSKLGLRTDKDVWGLFDALEGLSKKDLEWWQHVSGLTFCVHGILYNKALREFVAPSKVRYDPMHILASNGLMNTELKLVLDKMKETIRVYFQDFRTWEEQQLWTPKTTCWNKVREKSATDHIKANASAIMYEYPLFRWFVISHYGGDAPEAHIQSFLRLCDICDVFRSLKHGADNGIAARLPPLVSAYIPAFVEAYGYMTLRFKHHQLVHLHEQIVEDEMVVDCWVLERKHIAIKQAMANNKAMRGIERTALSRALNSQLRLLECPGWKSRMTAATRPFPELAAQLQAANVEISRSMNWCGSHLAHGNAVFLDSDRSLLLVVVACLAIDDTWALMARQTTSQSKGQYWSTWRVEPEVVCRRMRDSDIVLHVAFHRYVGPQCLEVLH